MKKFVFSALFLISALGLKAQEVSVGMEFYNRYVFRGVDFGNAPSLQPSLEFSTGGFTLGAWGASLFDVFVGAGDCWHTTEGSFQVVNIGIAATKELTLTEQFSLPLSGAVILNPNTEQLHLVFGLSF